MERRKVFIVGGGPSLKGFSFEKLKGLDTIAVNVAALDVPEPTYCITADSKIYRQLEDGEFKDVDTSWVVVSNPDHTTLKFRQGQFTNTKTGFVHNPFTPNILIRNAGVEGLGFSFKDFKTGYNSGFCAFQLAVLLGYEEIYLLGFDMGGGNRKHYHNRYKGKAINNTEMRRFCQNFVLALGQVSLKTNIKVFSCSEQSKLNAVIPYVDFKNVLKEIKEAEKPVEIKEPEEPKTLSILICTLYSRKLKLQRLLRILRPQKVPGVEILIEIDNGGMSIGAKRNILLKDAQGDYICFVDDDDEVSEDYVFKIMKAIQTEADCCNLVGEIYQKRKNRTRTFKHSIEYHKWFEKDGVYYRCPNHLNAVKRELAQKVRFKDISMGEDQDYSMRLLPLLETEAQIDGVLYFYKA